VPLSRERDVALVADVAPNVCVRGDGAAIFRALVAVVHNALKFTPGGRSVHVAVARSADAACVRVVDDGPGFSDDALAHATERFWRADPARSPGSGSGLGLSLARAAVERNGGTIVLENAGTSGHAVVVLRFPAAAELA
jgi:signal transduction histidine kinase